MQPNPAAVKPAPPASDETFLITWLFDRDAECPLCKYNLRGLTTPRCPECGEALKLGVSLVEPYLKAWIALVVAVLPPAGFGAFFLIIFAIESMHGYGGGLNHIQFWDAMGLLYILGCIPAAIAALALRRKFQQLEKPTQRLVAGIAWLLLLIVVGSVVAQIR